MAGSIPGIGKATRLTGVKRVRIPKRCMACGQYLDPETMPYIVLEIESPFGGEAFAAIHDVKACRQPTEAVLGRIPAESRSFHIANNPLALAKVTDGRDND